MTPAAVARSPQRMTPEQQIQAEAEALVLGLALVQGALEAQLTAAVVELIFWQALIQRQGVKDGSNWYAYVNNDPVNFTDPDGLISLKASDGSTVDTSGTYYYGKSSIPAVPGYPETGSTAWRKANDPTFIKATEDYNNQRNLQPGDSGFVSPEQLKAQAMIESGGEKDKKAFLSDPLQVNNPGDWVDKKTEIGLSPGQKMTPKTSADASLKWLDYKGHTYDQNGNVTGWKGDEKALRDYNGNKKKDIPGQPDLEHRDWYGSKIVELRDKMVKNCGK